MQSGKIHFELTYQVKCQFLHYLRHILREVTYLPDPFARKVHHAYILHRFRAYRPAKQKLPLPPWGVKQKWVRDEEHLNKLLKDCRDRLAWLYRAASGDRKALRRALFLTYGRIGPRKHELLRPYTRPDIPKNSKELSKALTVPRSKSFKLPLSRALEAIAREQGRQGSWALTPNETNVKRFLGDILPKKNIWGWSMPLNRLKNAKRKQSVELMNKLYPPLPDEEFKRLQGLATGTIPCPLLPTRRARLNGLPELPKTTISHRITPRTMRRLWSELVAFCSTIKKNEATGQYKVSWGVGKYSALNKPMAVGGNTSLFAQTIEPM
ncbi:MAG: hypothetical protein GOMPHAMPRED_003827 [Gomphillus americanus]|uniref:LYR motif-containing protein Cup1-like N-terminal domain-containing protein n=1 Tax=Gomphillus americanus TaxID=1940652 RepID=A0A8H3FQ65_9LECA|nr:MAG: hypothetical protein GOMPHAMPRED_003827 [Gomphillus americanus]